MSRAVRHAAALLLAFAAAGSRAADPVDPSSAIHCRACDGWNTAAAPFRVHGSTWYVGPAGLTVLMIETADGLVLLDGALPQSVPQIEANLGRLGHRLDEVRWILVSHAHFDHVGGIAALQQASGAKVAASPNAAAALRRGDVPADDPQATFSAAHRFAPVAGVVELADGEQITLGGLAITAHHTPGHTPGGSSWSWRSCEHGECITAAYVDSLTAVSDDGFRFSDDPARVAAFEQTFATVAAIDCQLLIATHPGSSRLFERRDQAAAGDADAFVEPGACRHHAERAAVAWRERLAREAAD